MHQHAHTHAIIPILDQSLTILPAPMAAQDSNFNTHLPRAAARPSFAPVTAFHRATQKPFRSTKRGRWGALHVCIAWKIYYNEQLKKMQQKPNSLHRELTPEYLATRIPGTVQHKESDKSSCIHPHIDSPCGHSAYVNTADRSETAVSSSYPSDLYTPPPASVHSRLTRREKQPPNLHWKEKLEEKEKHGAQQVETTKDLPLRDHSLDPTTTPEPDGRHDVSLDRKRKRECDSSIRVKMVKHEIVDEQFESSTTLYTDPSPFGTAHTRPPSHSLPVQDTNRRDLSAMYPNSSRCKMIRTPGGLVPYPGAELHPYQSASWEPIWDAQKRTDLHFRQIVLKEYSLNTCKAIRTPLAAMRQKEAFHGFLTPPLYFPLALRQQETVYLRGREFLHSRHENCHLHRAGCVAASYLEP
ncbi:hypothetical protein VZT92_020846 [Zoarces viviparus]|uniref:Uncharacterized protein n=1 Tax=Zoarces viviparus TaxID=48416 RepID=A0AAW1EEW6_ZOAVI